MERVLAGPTRAFRNTVARIVFSPRSQKKKLRVRAAWILLSCAVVALVVLEVRTSWLQSQLFASVAGLLTYLPATGPAEEFRHPHSGPYDIRLGYSRLGEFAGGLKNAGWQVEKQAQPSAWLRRLMDWGLFPTYREKNQAGLTVLDRHGQPMYASRIPERVYPGFDSIPQLVVQTLLFVENREALDAERLYQNPAVEWDRLANAMVGLGLSKVFPGHYVTGGSTLATQLEKVRHSPNGITASPGDKLRQMLSASLRAYKDGRQTWTARQRIVCDYLNSLPLAAMPGYGEIHGLGDGLAAWFGADFDEANRLLAAAGNGRIEDPARTAVAYRQVLTLILAIQQPTRYLLEDRRALESRVDHYLRLLAGNGVISAGIRDLALQTHLDYRRDVRVHQDLQPSDRKGLDSVRIELLRLLNVHSLYDLDRLDFAAGTTLDRTAQRFVTETLQRYRDKFFAARAGLVQYPMLYQGDPASVTYSVTLYERTPGANVLRVQADNYDHPLNISEGTKLELGSTAKLRTLVSYLEAVVELHRRFSGFTFEQLESLKIPKEDRLTQWAREYLLSTRGSHLSVRSLGLPLPPRRQGQPGLLTAEDQSLAAMLEAAMNRKYSASPYEAFFTGGGLHQFSNFESEDNGRLMNVREAFQRSVNLVFIRLMRDVVRYHAYRLHGVSPAILEDKQDPARHRYLVRFAAYEGGEYLTKFYRRYQGLDGGQALAKLVAGVPQTPNRLAIIHRTIRPNATLDEFAAFLRTNNPHNFILSDKLVSRLFDEYGPGKFNWNDRGYLADIHPLELWLLEYMSRNPNADLPTVLQQSAEVCQEAYQWLFRPNRTAAQDRSIRILIEHDAFQQIHRAWKRHGYPFDRLVPSYATAIGSSGDTPAALAELMGIILSDGIAYPSRRLEELRFAEQTPFETVMRPRAKEGERVIPVPVAALLKKELTGVVEKGTGRRAFASLTLSGGKPIVVGGKTGTGDNRIESRRTNSSRVINRTATFVFFFGDRFFGTVTAFVNGPDAANYKFTSSLPVQVFRNLAPTFQSLLQQSGAPGSQPAEVSQAGRLIARTH